MKWEFDRRVCPHCESNVVAQGSQSHDLSGEFRTKEWWRAHPDQKPDPTQMCVHIPDPTDWWCEGCQHEFSLEEIAELIEPLRQEWNRKWVEAGRPIREEIGIAVVNPRGVKNASKSTKVG